MQIASVRIGDGAPLALIAGLNVIETADAALATAERLQAVAAARALPLVFKASFDKANRTRADGFRGPGLEAGLRILERVGDATGLPRLTDVHEPGQAGAVAEVVDALQVPAFLARQTDLVVACAATGRPLNLKKPQFVAPEEMRHAVHKARAAGAEQVLTTERGTSFGYHELVVDMRALAILRGLAPVAFDATHAVQRPGARDGASGGDGAHVATLARAATAVGVDALFLEVHPDPARAPVDRECQLSFESLEALLDDVLAIAEALASRGAAR